MNRYSLFIAIAMLANLPVQASEVSLPSKFDVDTTAKRFVTELSRAGIRVVEQQRDRKKQQVEILFNNPLFGSAIGQCHRGERKDVPLHAQVSVDNNGHTWLSYQQPDPHEDRFGIIQCGSEADKMRKVLESFAVSATE